MTNHNDAIERALERLDNECVEGYDGYLDKKLARPILTDLATEVRAGAVEHHEHAIRELADAERDCRDLRDRLAAVVERVEEGMRQNGACWPFYQDILNLARGEGGGDA